MSHAAGPGTEWLAFDPVGLWLFATASGNNELHAFRVNPLSGGLTNAVIPFGLAGTPTSVAAEGSGDRVFVGLAGGIATHWLIDGSQLDLLALDAEAVALAADSVAK